MCIIGDNGSGKSTLMKGILGLRKPMTGKIIFGDGLKQNEIGYMPQQTIVQKDFPASVEEIVISGRSYRELSGGQQQRVLLARALCATQKMLLLDEPVAGLDPETTEEFYELVKKLNREEQVTILMVSHDLHAVSKYASHVLNLVKDPVFFGTKEAYLKLNQKDGEVSDGTV